MGLQRVSALVATLGFFTLCLAGRAVAQQGHDFMICEGEFALCAASTCQPSGGKITVNVIGGGTATFPEYNCTCTTFDGRPAIADLNGGNMSCTPPHDQIWSLYQRGYLFRRRSQTGHVCRARASHHPSFAGRTSTRAISWSIALASPVIPPGKFMACRSRRVTVPSVNRWRARQWSRVPPSGRRRVREILRSASITQLAEHSQLLREPGTAARQHCRGSHHADPRPAPRGEPRSGCREGALPS